MKVIPSSAPGSDFPTKQKPGCPGCAMRGLGLCRILIDAGIEAPISNREPLAQFEKDITARRRMFRSKEQTDSVPVICDGWAAAVEYLPSGRRQILSFLLPGDLVSTNVLFENRVYHDVETITAVCYRTFDRAGLWEALVTRPELLESFIRNCVEEKHRLDELILDLGRRKADQRVVRLILELMERLTKYRAVSDQTFDFPLRQTHIADALGVTAPYVNQVLKALRKKHLIKFGKRSLTIPDPAKLRGMVDQ
jgi:CRP/FNR family transcriptional regulator, anaerobic regulatory protein